MDYSDAYRWTIATHLRLVWQRKFRPKFPTKIPDEFPLCICATKEIFKSMVIPTRGAVNPQLSPWHSFTLRMSADITPNLTAHEDIIHNQGSGIAVGSVARDVVAGDKYGKNYNPFRSFTTQQHGHPTVRVQTVIGLFLNLNLNLGHIFL